MTTEQERQAFGRRLTAEIGKAGFRLVYVAAAIKVPIATLERWTKGEGMPTEKAIRSIAAALKISPDRLLK